jgi:hypothetical protein
LAAPAAVSLIAQILRPAAGHGGTCGKLARKWAIPASIGAAFAAMRKKMLFEFRKSGFRVIATDAMHRFVGSGSVDDGLTVKLAEARQ